MGRAFGEFNAIFSNRLDTLNKHFPCNRIGIKLAPCAGTTTRARRTSTETAFVEKAKGTYGGFYTELNELGPA